jgi:hypothetical protein
MPTLQRAPENTLANMHRWEKVGSSIMLYTSNLCLCILSRSSTPIVPLWPAELILVVSWSTFCSTVASTWIASLPSITDRPMGKSFTVTWPIERATRIDQAVPSHPEFDTYLSRDAYMLPVREQLNLKLEA